jgi:flagellar biosynthesis protein FlhF
MKIKTFYTKTMAEALSQVKSHLGPEALLLSTKEVPRRSGAWGSSSGFEVVAAVDHPEDIDVFTQSQEPVYKNHMPESVGPDDPKPLLEEITLETYSSAGVIRRVPPLPSAAKPRKQSVKAAVDAFAAPQAKPDLPFAGRLPLALYQDLVKCEVDPSLARELVARGWDSLTAGQRRSRSALVRSVTEAALAVVAGPSTQDGMPTKKVVVFFGPTGVGKTTSIAKLAARLALANKKKVLLMTTDGYRIGAIEQLRSYAGLMGIPFCFVDQASELPRAIQENTQRDFILIDTPGHGPRDLELMRGLASFLKEAEFVERHLVMSAATKPSDMRQIMDRFELCRPGHLLFTKLDETSTPGPILNELVRTQKAFSYYSNGQRVPDDLHAVPKERILDIVLNQNESEVKEYL